MPKFLTSWVLSAAALAVAAGLLGSHMNIGDAAATTSQQLITLALVAAVFTVINMYVAPVIKMLSLPFIIISLGFALLVINALLLLLTSRVADAFDVSFFIDGFWWAVLGSIVISIVNTFLGMFTAKR